MTSPPTSSTPSRSTPKFIRNPPNPPNAIDFYLSEVDERIAEKQAELELVMEKSEKVKNHAETIQNFIGKFANFEPRVREFQQEIDKMDKEIAEKEKEIEENTNFSQKKEELQLNSLTEKLVKVTEERKEKERRLLKLYEEEGKTMEDVGDSDEHDEDVTANE